MEDSKEWSGLCRRRPSLDDLDLIAAVDGEAGEEILAHLDECPHCAARAREIDQFQKLLRQRLYRILCPSSDQLLAYQQGWLDVQLQSQIRSHLRDCPHCAGELRLLSETTHAPPEVPTLISRLRRVIAVTLAPGPHFGLTPAYGGLRGAHGGQYAYRAENLELTLDVQRTARSDRVVLVGMLLDEEGVSEGMERATASLLDDANVVSSTMIDELGNFVLEDIAPGNYSLSLRLPTLEVVVEALTL